MSMPIAIRVMTAVMVVVMLVGGTCSVAAQDANNTAGNAVRTVDDSTKGHSQTVRGTVVDVVSNAPVAGASIAILVDGKVLKGAIAERLGSFRVRGIPVGRVNVRVTAIGYEPYLNENVLVTSGKEVVLNISLTESYATAQKVEVVYDRELDAATTNNEFATVSARAFNTEDTKRYAGSLGDPSRMAANFAGVVGANDARNDIVVRGNSPAAMLWQMEGMNIPNPNHFGSLGSTGGPVSMLNNNVLEKSDFMTSAFPAMYGNAIGGAFDLKLRDGNAEEYEFLVQLGFNGAELGAEGPLWQGASFLVNYRYSTLTLFNELGIDIGTGGATPRYQDLTLKLQTPIGDKGRLTLFAVGGLSDVKLLGDQLDTTTTDLYGDRNRNQVVDYGTFWSGLQYEYRFDDDTYLRTTLGATGTEENFTSEHLDSVTRAPSPNASATFTTTTISGVATLRHKFSPATSLAVGLQVDAQRYHLYNIDGIGEPWEQLFVDITDHAVLTQSYVQLKQRLTEWLSVTGGVHAQHYTIANAFAVEPRVGITAMVSPTLSLNAGYGLHSQRQGIYEYNVLTYTPQGNIFTNKSLGFSRSHHGVIGADWFISDAIRLKAEAYYQSLFDIPVTRTPSAYSAVNSGSSFAPNKTDSLVNEGTGRNYGVELTLEHFFRDGFFFLATASLFDSRYKGSDGLDHNTAFNTNYVLNLLGGKEFRLSANGVLSANARITTTGGRYLTPIDVEASQQAGEAEFVNSEAYSWRQPAYFRLDLKLGYRIEFASSTLEFSIDLQNITNHKNVFLQRYDEATGTITTEYQQGFFPVPLVRYTF